jgi:MtN3 and saliva related transmembrane protein
MLMYNIIAILAPIFNCVQVLPQLWKTFRTKRVKDLSYYTILLMISTNLLWFLHGYFIFDIPLLISGGINLVVNSSLMLLYMKYK